MKLKGEKQQECKYLQNRDIILSSAKDIIGDPNSSSNVTKMNSLKSVNNKQEYFISEIGQIIPNLRAKETTGTEGNKCLDPPLYIGDSDLGEDIRRSSLGIGVATKGLHPKYQDEEEIPKTSGFLSFNMLKKKRKSTLGNKKKIKKVKYNFIVHQKHLLMARNSCCCLNEKNKLRRYIVWFIEWKYFEYFILLLIILNAILLGIRDYTDRDNTTKKNKIIEQCEYVFITCFTLECILKISGMGLIFEEGSYLRDGWNWLDFVVVVTGLTQWVPGMPNWSVLRTFRLLRPLRTLGVFPSMKVIVETLFSTGEQLMNILFIVIFFFTVFATIGLTLFSGLTHYRCRMTDTPVDRDWKVVADDWRLCGTNWNSLHECGSKYTCGNLYEAYDSNKYNIPSSILDRDSKTSELNWGYSNFDHIGFAFLTIFQCATLEGWSHIMYMFQDSYSQIVSSFYFIILIFVCFYFVLNLTIAVMLLTFTRLQQVKKKAVMNPLERKASQMNLDNYNAAEDVHAELDNLDEKDKMGINCRQKLREIIEKAYTVMIYHPVRIPNGGYHRCFLTKYLYTLVKTPIFTTIMMLLLLIIGFIFILDRYPDSPVEKLDYIIVVFTYIFVLEITLKIAGLGPKLFFSNRDHISEFLIVIIATILTIVTGKGSFFIALRLYRPFSLFLNAKPWESLKILLTSISLSIQTILNFMILLCILIYAYSLMGMQFFAGYLRFDEKGQKDLTNGKLPREHFDNLLWALITVFEILLRTNWNKVLYDCMRAVGGLSTLYFVSLLAIGNFVMLYLFIAILVGYYIMARKMVTGLKSIRANTSNFNKVVPIEENTFKAGENISSHSFISNDLTPQSKNSGNDDYIEDISPRNKSPKVKRQSIIRRPNLFKKATILAKNPNIPKTGIISIQECEDHNFSESSELSASVISGENLGVQLYEMEKRKANEKLDNLINLGDIDQIDTIENNAEAGISPFNGGVSPGGKSLIRLSPRTALPPLRNQRNMEGLVFPKAEKIPHTSPPSSLESKEGRHLDNAEGNSGGELVYYITPEVRKGVDSKIQEKIIEIESPDLEVKGEKKGSYINSSERQGFLGQMVSNIKYKERKITPEGEIIPTILIREVSNTSSHSNSAYRFGSKSGSKSRSSFSFNSEPQPPPNIENRGLCNYLKESSLFVFHNKCWLRRYIIDLVITSTVVTDYRKEDTIDIQYIRAPRRKGDGGKSFMCYDSRGSLQIEEAMNEGNPCSCKWMKNNKPKVFDTIILIVIILSSLSLAFDNPLDDPESGKARTLYYMNIIFTAIFTLEALLKIIAMGFVWGKHTYLLNPWNILDLFVVITSILDLMYGTQGGGSTLKSFKALRALRALRPLRMINRNEGLKIIVNSLFKAIPSVGNLLLVAFMVALVFAMMGIRLYKGTFYYCYFIHDQSLQFMHNIYTKQDCLNFGGTWKNQRSNFDNIFISLLTLFEMMMGEGWNQVMLSGVDAVGIDKQPKENDQEVSVLFFLGFLVIGHLVILNLFVCVVIDSFNQMKQEITGLKCLTKYQLDWVNMQRFMLRRNLHLKRVIPENACRKKCYNIVQRRAFEGFISGCIILNTLILAMKYYRMNKDYAMALEIMNLLFGVVFNIECAIKLFAWGKSYFHEDWNKFDFLIVCLTDFGLILLMLDGNFEFYAIAQVVRSFRIMRIFRLIGASKKLKVIVDTLVFMLPSLANIASLVFLLLFIYAALGMNIFAGVMYQKELNEHANFRSFETSLSVLLRCATGEKWNILMGELANTDGYKGKSCVSDQDYDERQRDGILGCGSFVAYPFFLTYMILMAMLVFNLFVAVVLAGFAEAINENYSVISADKFEHFLDKWSEYDPNATGWVSLEDLILLLTEVPFPLGFYTEMKASRMLEKYYYYNRMKNTVSVRHHAPQSLKALINLRDKYIMHKNETTLIKRKHILQYLIALNIPLDGLAMQAHFRDICSRLTRKAVIDHFHLDSLVITSKQLLRYLKKKWFKKFPIKRKVLNSGEIYGEQEWASTFIGIIWKLCWQLGAENRFRRQRKKPGEGSELDGTGFTCSEEVVSTGGSVHTKASRKVFVKGFSNMLSPETQIEAMTINSPYKRTSYQSRRENLWGLATDNQKSTWVDAPLKDKYFRSNKLLDVGRKDHNKRSQRKSMFVKDASGMSIRAIASTLIDVKHYSTTKFPLNNK